MVAVVRICPACRKTYPNTQIFCTVDGQQLQPCDSAAAATTEAATSRDNQTRSAAPTRRLHWPRETLVGIAVVAVLAAVVSSVVVYRQSQTLRLTVSFSEAHGLKVGDSVYILGADVGQVTSAEFVDGEFAVGINVEPHAVPQFRSGSAFFIGYDKLLVNKRCIVVYVSDPTSATLKSGDKLRGNDSLVAYYMELLRTKGPVEAGRVYDSLKAIISDQVQRPRS